MQASKQRTPALDVGRQDVEEPLEWKDPTQTEDDFVVNELVTPLAHRLEFRWLNAVQREVESSIVLTLCRFVSAVVGQERTKSTDSPASAQGDRLEAARADLVADIQRNPEALVALRGFAHRPRVKIEPRDGKGTGDTRKVLRAACLCA